jgi:hypothetical protein
LSRQAPASLLRRIYHWKWQSSSFAECGGKLRRLQHGVKSYPLRKASLFKQQIITPLAAVILYGVHHGADVAVDDAVFGFIVFFVCTESWVKPHPVANGKIVVHMPPAVLFHDGLFLARVGVMTVVYSV